jgi:hypothetical protein
MIRLVTGRKRNKYAMILLVLLLLVMLASSVFIVTHAEHHCIGVGCQTCQEILLCELILGSVGFAAALILSVGVLRQGARAVRGPDASIAGRVAVKIPLFSDSVRLNI